MELNDNSLGKVAGGKKQKFKSVELKGGGFVVIPDELEVYKESASAQEVVDKKNSKKTWKEKIFGSKDE